MHHIPSTYKLFPTYTFGFANFTRGWGCGARYQSRMRRIPRSVLRSGERRSHRTGSPLHTKDIGQRTVLSRAASRRSLFGQRKGSRALRTRNSSQWRHLAYSDTPRTAQLEQWRHRVSLSPPPPLSLSLLIKDPSLCVGVGCVCVREREVLKRKCVCDGWIGRERERGRVCMN